MRIYEISSSSDDYYYYFIISAGTFTAIGWTSLKIEINIKLQFILAFVFLFAASHKTQIGPESVHLSM